MQGKTYNIKLITIAVIFLFLLCSLGLILSNRAHRLKNATALPREASIQITHDGFMPADVKVTVGTHIIWTNTDTAPHAVASNPHPEHTDKKGLLSSVLAPGETYTFIVKEKGTFGFHDENELTHNGKVVVE